MGGDQLLTKYNSSLIDLLNDQFPDYNWLPWKFPHSEQLWANPKILRDFFDWASGQKDININVPNDWLNVNINVCLY